MRDQTFVLQAYQAGRFFLCDRAELIVQLMPLFFVEDVNALTENQSISLMRVSQ